MKLPGAQPAEAPAAPSPASTPDLGVGGADKASPEPEAQPSSDDKPFDTEPFNAGVEADEESDPKKFIEQLTGKLGQSLRKYNEAQGTPDFELEKFAINSLLSASHTSEMDANDQDDIIKKVKEAGNNNDDEDNKDNSTNNNDNNGSPDDGSNGDFTGNVGGNNHDTPASTAPTSTGMAENIEEEEGFLIKPKKNNMFQPGSNDILKESCWKGYKQVGMKEKDGKSVPNCVPINENAGESQNYMFWQNLKTIHHAAGELLGMDQTKVDAMIANGHAWAVDHIATSSDDIEEVYHFLEANLKGDLNIPEKSSIIAKIKNKLQETFNQDDDMSEPMTEPMVKPAPTKPAPLKTPNTRPNIAPSRRNKPFLPMPEVQPDPKAMYESFDFASSERNFHDKEELSDLQKYVNKDLKIKNSNNIIGLITPDKARYFSILKSLKNEINNMRIQNNVVVASDSQDTQWIFDILGVDETNVYLEFTGTAK